MSFCLVSDHVTVSFARSGGPGGQNVNKGCFFCSSYYVSMFFCLRDKNSFSKVLGVESIYKGLLVYHVELIIVKKIKS